ncbi:MAG: DUF5606 domain-containing protein [Bacteroidetes bacterium]|nr:DUF5606 domain-containing protein [Bacteroidota bacterium]
MDLTKIVSISGKSGLFKVVSQGKNAVIVESLSDQKRFPAFGHEKMSSLEEISVFTTGEDRLLKEVFKALFEKLEGKAAVDPKSDNDILLKFFQDMVPDFDQERVYVSDIRKMINWYNTLLAQNLLDFSEPAGEKTEEAGDTEKPVNDETTAEGAGTSSGDPSAEAKPEKKAPKKKKSE